MMVNDSFLYDDMKINRVKFVWFRVRLLASLGDIFMEVSFVETLNHPLLLEFVEVRKMRKMEYLTG